jgi:DHA1 family inner membrane transport protein
MNPNASVLTPPRQRAAIATMMSMEFLNVMDFLVLMPLAPLLMKHLSISLQEFGLLVASYSVGAAGGGILGALFIDRFDRKRALISLFSLFSAATLLCAFAPSFAVLLVARVLAGMGGGGIEALSYTIIGDVFPEDGRAKATGQLMAGYALATIIGVPAGLALASAYGWNAPFLVVSMLGATACIAACFTLLPMTGHRRLQQVESAWQGFLSVFRIAHHRWALLCTTMLMFGSFAVVPFMGSYFVFNLGVPESQLSIAYLVAGTCAVFSAPFIGWLADRHGQYRVFWITGLLAIAPVLAVTNLVPMAFAWIVACSAVFMVLITGYYVPAQALITSTADDRYRGRFQSLSTTFEQIAIGATTAFTGWLIGEGPNQELVGYDTAGWFSVATIVLAIVLMSRLPAARARPAPLEPVAAAAE